jgi:hypothetical protein
MSANTLSTGRALEFARAVEERRPTITPADLVVLVLTGLLAGGLLLAWVSGLSIQVAMVGVCLPALATIGYALFYAPPVSKNE